MDYTVHADIFIDFVNNKEHQKAIDLYEALPDEGKKEFCDDYHIVCLIGYAYGAIEVYDTAILYFKKSLGLIRIYQKQVGTADSFDVDLIYIGMFRCYESKKKYLRSYYNLLLIKKYFPDTENAIADRNNVRGAVIDNTITYFAYAVGFSILLNLLFDMPYGHSEVYKYFRGASVLFVLLWYFAHNNFCKFIVNYIKPLLMKVIR
jgi:tetratricopeptide (TPR) repeat protein